MDWPQKRTKWMKPDTEDHILNDSIYMKFIEKVKLKKRKVNRCVPRVGCWGGDWLQMDDGTFGVIEVV